MKIRGVHEAKREPPPGGGGGVCQNHEIKEILSKNHEIKQKHREIKGKTVENILRNCLQRISKNKVFYYRF